MAYADDFHRQRYPDNNHTRTQDARAAADEEAKEAARQRSQRIWDTIKAYKSLVSKKTEDGEDNGDSVQGG